MREDVGLQTDGDLLRDLNLEIARSAHAWTLDDVAPILTDSDGEGSYLLSSLTNEYSRVDEAISTAIKLENIHFSTMY